MPKILHQIRTRRIVAGSLAVVFALVIFVFSHIPGESYPAHPGFLNYVAHFGEYFILASLLTVAFWGGRLKSWQVMLIALLLASTYAATDEIHQYFIPGRVSDPMDWLTDTVGALLGALATSQLLKRIDARKESD